MKSILRLLLSALASVGCFYAMAHVPAGDLHGALKFFAYAFAAVFLGYALRD